MPAEFIGGFFTLTIYLIITFGVYKATQIAADMGEIKELLKDIRRNTDSAELTPPPPGSAENLVRAIHAGSFADLTDEQPTVTHAEPQR